MKKLLTLLIIFHSAFIIIKAQTKLFVPPLPEMNYAQIVDKSKFNGDRWSYMEAGDPSKPTVVWLHGLGGSSADWPIRLPCGKTQKGSVLNLKTNCAVT